MKPVHVQILFHLSRKFRIYMLSREIPVRMTQSGLGTFEMGRF